MTIFFGLNVFRISSREITQVLSNLWNVLNNLLKIRSIGRNRFPVGGDFQVLSYMIVKSQALHHLARTREFPARRKGIPKHGYHVTQYSACIDLCKKYRQIGKFREHHYNDVIMDAMASQFTSLTIVYSTVYSDTDERKHQSYGSLAFVRGIHQWPVNSPQKGPETRKMFPFDDVFVTHLRVTEWLQTRQWS